MDTLKLLRDVTMGNITVEENDGIFEFSNGEKIKGDTKTIYKRKNQQQYYNLNELYHYIKVALIDKKTSKFERIIWSLIILLFTALLFVLVTDS